jgi:hypothetical protein
MTQEHEREERGTDNRTPQYRLTMWDCSSLEFGPFTWTYGDEADARADGAYWMRHGSIVAYRVELV